MREQCGLPPCPPEPVRPDRPLVLRQADYPNGIQIWASNPALVWTAERAEEKGIHLHAFDQGGIKIDETFSSIRIDDVDLSEEQIQYFMAQSTLDYLGNKIAALVCPECKSYHFDRGEKAFEPHSEHECETCSARFPTPGRRRLVVSNPFFATRQVLADSSVGNAHG
jgi:hypothetical protein